MSRFARPLLVLARAAQRSAVVSSPRALPSRAFGSTHRRTAVSTTATSSSFDPQEVAAQTALDAGTAALEQGDLDAAAKAYTQSLTIKKSAIGNYNLGVVRYQQQDLPGAIACFLESLALSVDPKAPVEPPSYPPTPAQIVIADTHTNLGAAYILSNPPRPDLALSHLQSALELTPDDGEVCFNLAAVLEASGEEEEALVAYTRARGLGIERAAVNERNTAAKLLGKRLKEEQDRAKEDSEGKGSVKSTTL